MSEKELVERISELLLILKETVSDLDQVRTALKRGVATIQPKQTAVPETTSPFTGESISKPEQKPAKVGTLGDVEKAFPQDLAGLLYFEVTDKYFLAKPRQYLESDNFRKIAAIVRDQLGGEYFSAGRDSHFRIARDRPSPEPPKTIGFVDEELEKLPEFDPELLMQWSWKGKKKDDGTYAPGSLSYGWDFANNFPENVIKVLEKKGPQVIGGYRFTLDLLDKEKGTYVVHTRKEKEGRS